MATHWLSFRLADNSTYSERYDKLLEAIRERSSKWWLETSAFLVFDTTHDIDQIAAAAKAAVDPRFDIVLIGMTDFKSARLIGASQDKDIFGLIPFVKNV
ncbi:MAG: hypothetical protein ACK4R3_02965 [Aliihoeflea sp.]